MSSRNPLKVILLSVAFLLTIASVQCNQEDEDCTISINPALSTESIILNQVDNCETVFYEITASKESSIIYITTSPYLNDTSSSTTSTYLDDTSSSASSPYSNDTSSSTTPKYLHDVEREDAQIQNLDTEMVSLMFEELSFLSSGENYSIVMDRWYFTSKNFLVPRQYLSRTPMLRIRVKVTGNWSGNGVRLVYKEVEFNVFKSKTSKELGEISLINFEENFQNSYHHPNSAYIFQILKTRNINASSISLTLKFDINEGIGEYLLIGSGAIPFHGPPPLFIANDKNEKKFQVNDENAYIVYVSTSSLREKSLPVFSIRWKHRGSKITVDEVVDQVMDDVLQSIQVCIYNITAGLEQLKKPKTEQFKPFKEELARKSNELLSSMKDPLSNISSSRISFYRLSAIDKSAKFHEDGILYVMLKVEGSSKGRAAFDREFLQKVFRSFTSFQNEDGYQIGECPKRTPVSAGFYAMIPLFCMVIFSVWIWNQYSFSHFFIKRSEERGIEENEQENMPETAENDYSDLPLSGLNSHGRRLTQDYNNTIKDHRENFGISGCRNRSSLKPEHNEAFEDDENISTLPKYAHDEGASNEIENDYDSLKSSRSMNKVYDTKL